MHSPLFASHISNSPILLSPFLFPEPLAKYFPSGLQQTDHTPDECPSKVRMHSPLFTSHSLMVPSTEPLAKYFLSGLATTELTTSECPFKIRMHSPLFTSHNLRVSSSEPLAKYFPSGLASTQLTLLEFPFKVCNNRKSFGESDSIVEVCSRLFCSYGISFCVYFAKIKNFHTPTKFSFFFSTYHADLHESFLSSLIKSIVKLKRYVSIREIRGGSFADFASLREPDVEPL